ncbi:YifB family Mg chelatase-like AAA ATPase [Solirubrobacter soli]|uniref:YifB family Mg chelatase-like AAA ATPase n=1 Tax=Solirubrobacter soli TaxID=363832 RepID=UPI0003F8EBEB|nr:YifB family Mg chelatase-like AAA ATPase [Solirubrobacter soli]
MLARVATFAVDGVDARRVWVEADIRQGLPAFTVVGLADKAVREARERVRAAMVNSGYEFPLRRITVNLAPAYLRKVGPAFDLPLAVSLLVASYQLEPEKVEGCAIVGELSLTGEVRAIRGALAVAEGVRRAGLQRIVLPSSRAREAALVPDIEVVGVGSLQELVATLRGDAEPQAVPDQPADPDEPEAELADVRGHNGLIPGLEVAAAGGHNLFLQGPPGTGKTMIARRLPSILPPLAPEEAIEVTRIQSIAGLRGAAGLVTARPFRAPHHTISAAGLVGGANPPQPGEATLAHRGVLFLDELSEFARPSLEALRQPLEDGRVTIVRGQHVMVFPTSFMLVAASNPCPCGRGGTHCECSQVDLARHRRRLSGPLLDRIDILMRVERPPADALRRQIAPASKTVRERVIAARERQLHRLADHPEVCNAQLTSRQIREVGKVTQTALSLLGELYDRHTLSARGHTRILRVARTVADLDGADEVGTEHVSIATSLRFDDSHQLAEAA